MRPYYRPIAGTGPARPKATIRIAGGWAWAAHAERLERGRPGEIVPISDVPVEIVDRISRSRAPVAGLGMDSPRIMGILNATPDSFSDGGQHADPEVAIARARELSAQGIDILDIGGESTRPGAETVAVGEEIARTRPVIDALKGAGGPPLSIDTRKAAVAQAALSAGAAMVNDVSAMLFDESMAGIVAQAGVPVCLMHAQGDPKTMQDSPSYDDVLLDVYDFLEERIAAAEAAGVDRARIVVDPGIGFGKTITHNLALLQRVALFHALGCPVLVGASRKRFIGTLSGAEKPDERMPGSVAVALAAVSQGVQIVRVHDTVETKQALALWRAASGQ